METKVYTNICEKYKLKHAQKGTSSILYSDCQCTEAHSVALTDRNQVILFSYIEEKTD